MRRGLALWPALLVGACVAAPPRPLAPPFPAATPGPGAADAALARNAALAGLALPGATPVSVRDVTEGGGQVRVSLLAVPDTVFFDFGEAAPRADAAPALDAIARALRDAPPGSVLTVAGNTDAVGSAAFNQALSSERAENVVAALVARGVPPSALRAVGFGRTRPVASNATDEGRARNRRVELALSPSFAANASALAAEVPVQASVPEAAEPAEADPSPRMTLARTPAKLSIHPNRPEPVRPNALGSPVPF